MSSSDAKSVRGIPIGTATPLDGNVLAFNAAQNRFDPVPQSGGGGGPSIATSTLLFATTSDATPTELTTDGAAPSGVSNRLEIPDNTTITYDVMVTARRTDALDESAGYLLQVVVDRNTGPATLSLVGFDMKAVLGEDSPPWDVNVGVDTTFGVITFTVTGEAGKDIEWSLGATALSHDRAIALGLAGGGPPPTNGNLLFRQTTDDTPTPLTLDGDVPSTENQFFLPDNTTATFLVLISARRTDVLGENAGYIAKAVIKRDVGAPTTELVGFSLEENIAEDSPAWDPEIEADSTSGSMRIVVTGEVGKTINWAAEVLVMSQNGALAFGGAAGGVFSTNPILSSVFPIITTAGTVTAGRGERRLYDATALAPLDIVIEAPATGLFLDDRWGLKNMSTSTTDITVDGNGSLIEDPNSGTMVTDFVFGGLGVEGASMEWFWDGSAWRLS